jgi:hypothetical protein
VPSINPRYFAADLAAAGYFAGIDFAIATKRISPLWSP